MDSVFAVLGKDFVILAADSHVAHSILKLKDNEDKTLVIDGDKLLGLAGEPGERLQFGDYIQKNIHLLRYKYGKRLSTKETANYMRSEMAQLLRKSPFFCFTVLAGHDADGPALYWIDYMATMQKVKTAAQGYCSYFLGGILDSKWKPDMTYEEAVDLVTDCMNELGKRFIMTQHKFVVQKVDKDGIKDISTEVSESAKKKLSA